MITALSIFCSPANIVLSPASIWSFFTGSMTSTWNISWISGFWTLATVSSHSPFSIPRIRVPSTFAIPTSEDVKLIFRLFASSGVHTALRFTVRPARITSTGSVSGAASSGRGASRPARLGSSGSSTTRFFRLIVTLVTRRITCTVTVARRTRLPFCIRSAMIRVLPLATAVTVPSSETVATFVDSLE